MWTRGSLYTLQIILARESFKKCLGELTSNKSMKHNTIDSRECLNLAKDETNHHVNTIIHDGTCVLKTLFNYYQVKYIKELQNVKNAFLKKLPGIEQKS